VLYLLVLFLSFFMECHLWVLSFVFGSRTERERQTKRRFLSQRKRKDDDKMVERTTTCSRRASGSPLGLRSFLVDAASVIDSLSTSLSTRAVAAGRRKRKKEEKARLSLRYGSGSVGPVRCRPSSYRVDNRERKQLNLAFFREAFCRTRFDTPDNLRLVASHSSTSLSLAAIASTGPVILSPDQSAPLPPSNWQPYSPRPVPRLPTLPHHPLRQLQLTPTLPPKKTRSNWHLNPAADCKSLLPTPMLCHPTSNPTRP
jgi:hypothetical protein